MKEFIEQGVLKTTIVCNEDKSRVFSVIRDYTEGKGKKGEEYLLITLWPAINNITKQDLSGLHYQNHMEDINAVKTHFLFLFSRVISNNARPSTKGLSVDSDNLVFLEKTIRENKDAKIIISWGESASKSHAVIATKIKVLEIIKKLRGDEVIWQLTTEGSSKNGKSIGNKHILYMGIRFRGQWKLEPYVIPEELMPENAQKRAELASKNKNKGNDSGTKEKPGKAKEEA